MPPAALSSIVLTDGTTTATLSDTSKYGLLAGGWSPQVATRRKSVLGGRPYTQVVEELRLDVYGTTTADALANLAAILRLIDQADRWNAGESFSPVRLEYQPQGSILAAPVKSLVYGFGDNSPPATLPATYNDLLMVYEISDVSIRFVRDGAWYGEEEQIVIPKGTHPSIASGTFTNFASHLSPVKVELGPLPDQGGIAAYEAGYLLIADRAARIEIVTAEGMSPGGDWGTDADAARNPQGSGVLTFTPSVAARSNTLIENITLDEGRRVGIVAAVRNSHATTEFAIEVQISGPAERSVATTRPYIVDASTTDPRIVMLGVVLCEEAYASMQVFVTPSAAAGTLSIDYFALINLDNPTSRILAIGPIDVTKSIPAGAGPSFQTSHLTVDPRPLTGLTPQVRLIGDTNPTLDYAVPDWYRGDAYLLSLGTTIAVLYCGRTATYWTPWDTSAGAIIDADFTLTRRVAYLAPE